MRRWFTMLLVASVVVFSGGTGFNSACYALQEDGKAEADATAETKNEKPDTDEAEEEKEKVDPAEAAFGDLQKEMVAAERAFMKAFREASEEERADMLDEGTPRAKFAKRFLEFAKENQDTPQEFTAIAMAQQFGGPEIVSEAIDLLANRFADDKRIAQILPGYVRSIGLPEPMHQKFLDTLMAKSSNEAVIGGAKFAAYQLNKKIEEIKARLKSNPGILDSLDDEVGEFIMKDRGDIDAKNEALLETIARDYSDVPFGRSKLSKLVEGELFVLKHLSVGKVAPDIEGVDLDGEAFKLSDYRGKIVLLDFWGDW